MGERGVMPSARWARRASIASAILAGLAALAMVVRADIGGLITALLVGLLLFALSKRSATVRELGPLVPLLYSAHLFALMAIQIGSSAFGLGGFIVGDDANFERFATNMAAMWHGAAYPGFAGDAYLLNTYTYLESIVFFLFGSDVTILEVLNAGLAVGAVILFYALSRSIDRRAARVVTVLIAFYPSAFIWSSLNLKDALVLFVLAAVLLATTEFIRRPRWWLLAVALGCLPLVVSVRQYIFVELAAVLILGVILIARATWRERAGYGALAIAALGLIIITQPPMTVLNAFGSNSPLLALEQVRYGMGLNARTGFQSDLPAEVGSTYVVPTEAPPSASATVAGQTPAPGPSASPSVVHVSPGVQIVVVSGTSAPSPAASPPIASPTQTPVATPAPSTGVAYVHPGDIVVVGSADTTPAPTDQRHALSVPASGGLRFSDSDPHTAVPRTLSYLPRGLAYALFAPFPWAITRGLDLLTVPEMLLWYVIVAMAVVAVITRRDRWRWIAMTALYAGMTAGALALTEGNVGTLFRHRAMFIAPTIVVAGPVLARVVGAVSRRLRLGALTPD